MNALFVKRGNDLHRLGGDDIRYTRCGIYVGDETWDLLSIHDGCSGDGASRIHKMSADHYRESTDWERQQKMGLADVMFDVIKALDVPPHRGTVPDGEVVLFGSWLASDVVAAAKP